MVVLLDLEEDAVDSTSIKEPYYDPYHHALSSATSSTQRADVPVDRPNPNVNSFSASLSCYPVVCQIASHLDLNSLHDLSATCRQFRANMLQNRTQLMKHSLRCTNEEVDMGPRLADRLRESRQAWQSNPRGLMSGKITSGRVGKCARDMVGECRRCGTVVCRNCTIKPPSLRALQDRHRRLCRGCMKAPLQNLLLQGTGVDPLGVPSFTTSAFKREACSCPESVFICLTCGSGMRSADTTYMRGWNWRTRYSTYLSGLGTGIGEGNEGVVCGKDVDCLAVREIEKEVDCNAEELAELQREYDQGRWGGTSYMTQEIEGIGGVMKKKVKKAVKVGQVVKEYEEERDKGDYLGRERRGENRSWCSWCARVIPSEKDKVPFGADLGRSLTDSSSSSL